MKKSKINIVFIRSAKTVGAEEKKYIGTTDEVPLENCLNKIKNKKENNINTSVEFVYSSPMIRCVEIAKVMYPDTLVSVDEKLAPYYRGKNTNCTYTQILQSKNFNKWAVCRGGSLDDGEDLIEFNIRCTKVFENIISEAQSKGFTSISIITHRLVLLTILKRFCLPRNYYKNWDIDFGEGYLFCYDTRLKMMEYCKNLR